MKDFQAVVGKSDTLYCTRVYGIREIFDLALLFLFLIWIVMP